MKRRIAKHAAADLATCRSNDDTLCRRKATHAAEWVTADNQTIRLPVCKRHARRKLRAGWGVVRAYQPDLKALAAQADRYGWRNIQWQT